MRVTFLLPGPASVPVGGIRVAYRLAEGLALRGHDVRILHPTGWVGSDTAHRSSLLRGLSWVKHWILRDYRPATWLPIPQGVRLRLIPSISPKWVGQSDAIVATGWRLFSAIATLPPNAGAKVALVQHLDAWDGSREDAVAAWLLPMHKVAVAHWMARELHAIGQECDVVPNAVDQDLFFLETPPEERRAPTVAFMGHDQPWKGTAFALQAVEKVREQIPGLEVQMFCTRPLPAGRPIWIRERLNPPPRELRGIYNWAQVFLAPSLTEGWDLPACEAMACGAALVASDIPARAEYAENQGSALLTPPGDVPAMAEAALRLLADDGLRVRLARRGLERVGELTWPRSAELFELALTRAVARL
ncbi:MAG: hypothetical protein A2Y78_13035 [Acidobacteria bacterium RBG_13_68_16]|nr:MAG: hypothetical protein A2Y78_13035 [Acidobacteria bacterium RBG_13_68_16]